MQNELSKISYLQNKKKRPLDKFLKYLIYLCTFLTVGILIWILGFVLVKGLGYLSLEFLTTLYKGDQTGILSMIINTLSIIGLTLVIVIPIGICAAIYLVEYAKQGRLIRIIKFTTETLAGIPSIIYGLFGLIFFVTILKLNFSLLSGALTLSIMVLPTIIRTTEESLKTVPKSYKEGSLALGATKLHTIVKVILPCAISGILTAVILSVGRIIGETAALMYTSGIVTKTAKSIMSSGRTLSLHLYVLAKEGLGEDQAFATATVLVIIVFIINFLANKFGKRLNKGKMNG